MPPAAAPGAIIAISATATAANRRSRCAIVSKPRVSLSDRIQAGNITTEA
jgi:hypothetical protein